MSFIHYKLITNKNFEKITFDGVSLSVFDLKKIILEKKFRKQVAAPTGKNGVNTTMPNKKNSDVDLEITNADTNEVYQRDTDLIPKNSRVRINRVLKSIGPAIAGGVTTSTQKQKEEKAQLSSLRDKFNTLSNAYSSPGSSPVNDFLEKNTDDESSIYSDFMGKDESNSNSSNLSMPYTEMNGTHSSNTTDISPLVTSEEKSALKLKVTIPGLQSAKNLPLEAVALPSAELLCPFMSEDKTLHLMDQAIIVPCCGYFICCEDCIRDRLDQNSYVECPHAGCIQEITSSHRLTPEMQLRNKVTKYIASNPTFTSLSTVPENMVVIQPRESATNDQSKLKPDNISSFTPIKINLPGSNKASSESPKDSNTTPPTTEHTGETLSLELDIDTKDRSRSLSRTTTTSSRSSSNSSSTSHGTIKSSSSGSRSENTPNLNTTPVTDEVPVEVPTATAPIVSQSNVVAPIQKSYNQYYNPSSQSMPFNQQMAQQQQFGNQFYNQQHMGQGFYNQQSYHQQQQHMQHFGQAQPFNNFSKQVAAPPGTDHFIQSQFPNQYQAQGQFNQFNPNFPHYNIPPPIGPNGFPMNQYQNSHFNQNQYNQWNPQPGIISAPISIHGTNQSNYNSLQINRHNQHRSNNYSSKYNRSRSRTRSRSRSRTDKHKRRNRSRTRSRSRSRNRKNRSSSRHKRSRYERVSGRRSSRDRRDSRSRSRSRSRRRDETRDKKLSSKDRPSDTKYSSKEESSSRRHHTKHSKSKRSSRSRSRSRRRNRDDRKKDKSEKKSTSSSSSVKASIEKPSEKTARSPSPVKDQPKEAKMEAETQNSPGPNPTPIENPVVQEIQSETQVKSEEVREERLTTIINGSPSKVIKLSSNTASPTPSLSASPTKKLKSKRKVVVLTQQNIYQQVQAVANINNNSISVSQNKENSNNNDELIAKASNGNNNYVNYSNSESDQANEEDEVDSDFLDINISDNINMTLV